MPVASGDAQPVIRFGRYDLLQLIAVGGMGELFLARQAGRTDFHELLVVKVLRPELASDSESVGLFLDEARIAAQLSHPNVAGIFDLGQTGGALFIAMEFIHGENLQRIIEVSEPLGGIPLSLAVRVVADAASGLQYAHKAVDASGAPLRVIHRDVSPQNILVSFDGLVKIIDFGIAKAAGRNSRTQVGQVRGKCAYMSPEQARGDPLDARTDIFALGVVLYELATRARLFRRESDLDTMAAVVQCDVPLPSIIDARVDSALEEIILTALAHDRTVRYQEAGVMAAALEDWLVLKRQTASQADLADYVRNLFASRLEEERKTGRPHNAGKEFKSDILSSASIPVAKAGIAPPPPPPPVADTAPMRRPAPVVRIASPEPPKPEPTTTAKREVVVPKPEPEPAPAPSAPASTPGHHRSYGLWIGLAAALGLGVAAWIGLNRSSSAEDEPVNPQSLGPTPIRLPGPDAATAMPADSDTDDVDDAQPLELPSAPAWFTPWLVTPTPIHSLDHKLQRWVRSVAGAKPPAKGAIDSATLGVIDAKTGKPLADALVLGQTRRLVFTDAKGLGSFEWVHDKSDSIEVTVFAPGFAASPVRVSKHPGVVWVSLPREDRVLVTGEVLRASGAPAVGCVAGVISAEGKLVELRRGQSRGPTAVPVARGGVSAVTSLRPVEEARPLWALIDAKGSFLFRVPSALARRAKVAVSCPNEGHAEAPLEVTAKEVLRMTIAPKGGVTVSGIIRDQAGKPIASRVVEETRSHLLGRTDAEGRYEYRYCEPALCEVSQVQPEAR